MHNVKLTILMCTAQWHSVHSQSCAITASFKFQNIFVAPRENLVPFYSHSLSLLPQPALATHQSVLHLYEFACSGHFIQIDDKNVWPFLCIFVYVA